MAAACCAVAASLARSAATSAARTATMPPSRRAKYAAVAAASAAITAPRLLASAVTAAAKPLNTPTPSLTRPTNNMNSLRRLTKAAPTVSGMPSASRRSSARALGSASASTCAVSWPCSAMPRSSPRGRPMASASACIRRGAASLTLLNSSPRSTPVPKACESCRIAEPASCAVAPETRSASATVSVTLATSAWPRPSARTLGARRA